MARFRILFLILPITWLLGCTETATDGYDLAGYQASSWQWDVANNAGPDITQNSGGSATTSVTSVEAADPQTDADRARMQTAAIVAVIGLIAIVILSDDASGCSGSACASKSSN